jgi:branched-chain amino acid transport system substrate-binding protein
MVIGIPGMLPVHLEAAEPVVVVGIFAETGIAATNNRPHIEVVRLAVEDVNKSGGLLGHPMDFRILDNKSTPIGSNLAAQQAVSLDATAVIGAAWSSHSLQVAPVLQKAKIPMITGSATNPKVTRFGNYIFRACFIDSFQAKAMARFARSGLGAQTAIVLEIANEEFSLTLAELFVHSFEAYGGEVLLKGSYQNDAVDFSGLLRKIQRLQADVIYAPGYGRDVGLLIKQAKEMGVNLTFLGADGWGGSLIYDTGGDALEGCFQTAHWHYGVRLPKSISLQQRYEKKYGKQIPHMNAPLNYDAVMLLADAVRRAGSLDRPAIRDALAETRGFEGATGTITLDEHGDPLNKPVVILKLGKHAPNYFKTIQP